MELSNETYDTCKWVAQIALPALGTFYFALCTIWGFPFGEQVLGTITALDVFLGTLLQLSSDSYNGDGKIVVDTSDPTKDLYTLVIPDYPEALSEKDMVTLRVSHQGKHSAEIED